MLNNSKFRIPSGYERGIRFGANWTMAISPYLILYIIMVILISPNDDSGNITDILRFAGTTPTPFIATVFLDGLFHAVFFVTVATLFVILREAFPVQASLILVCGAWQMLFGFSKGLISSYVFPQLGSAYIAAEAAFQPTFIPVASAFDALRNALQWMDSLGVMFVWILVSLLPSSTNLPRPIRWMGWAMTFGILVPDALFPGFLLVVLISLPWIFMLGRWMKQLTSIPNYIRE